MAMAVKRCLHFGGHTEKEQHKEVTDFRVKEHPFRARKEKKPRNK